MGSEAGRRTTFEVLNGLRGIAAIAVVNMHMAVYFGPLHSANVALAVDFFFVLSGFVIAFAYEERLRAGLPLRRFVLARVIRLYPLYLLGLIMGIAVKLTLDQIVYPVALCATIAANLFMLPFPVQLDQYATSLFPLNFPAWSLFFELIANIGYAALGARLTNPRLALAIGAGFLGLVAAGVIAGSLDVGTLRWQVLGGLARVTFSFFVGVALYRLWRIRPTRLAIHPALLFVLLPLPLLLKPGGPFGWLYELAVVACYMPMIVWLGAGSYARDGWLHASVALGALSYPLYMIHAPVWIAIRMLEGWAPTSTLIGYAPWSGIAITATLCAVAWWLDKAVDFPLRRRLSRALLHRPTHAADPEPAHFR